MDSKPLIAADYAFDQVIMTAHTSRLNFASINFTVIRRRIEPSLLFLRLDSYFAHILWRKKTWIARMVQREPDERGQDDNCYQSWSLFVPSKFINFSTLIFHEKKGQAGQAECDWIFCFFSFHSLFFWTQCQTLLLQPVYCCAISIASRSNELLNLLIMCKS